MWVRNTYMILWINPSFSTLLLLNFICQFLALPGTSYTHLPLTSLLYSLQNQLDQVNLNHYLYPFPLPVFAKSLLQVPTPDSPRTRTEFLNEF